MSSLQTQVVELTSQEGQSVCHTTLTKPIENAEAYSVALTKISSSLLFHNIPRTISAELVGYTVLAKIGVPLVDDSRVFWVGDPGPTLGTLRFIIPDVIKSSRYNTMEHLVAEFNRNVANILATKQVPHDAFRLAYNGKFYEFESKRLWSRDDMSSPNWEVYTYFALADDSNYNKELQRLFNYDPKDFKRAAFYVNSEDETLGLQASVPIKRRVPPNHPLHTYLMCIYCNVIEPGNFGDKKVPLLRTFPIPASETFSEQLNPPQYHAINVKEITDIEILLTNEMGEILPAQSGRLYATLHFKPNENQL